MDSLNGEYRDDYREGPSRANERDRLVICDSEKAVEIASRI